MNWIFLTIIVIIFGTLINLIHKKVLKKEHTMEVSTLFAIFNLLLAFFLIPLVDFNFSKRYLLVIYFVSWFATIGFYLIEKALRHKEISTVIPLSNFEPMFVAILAFIFLTEDISMYQAFGMLLIIFGGYVLETNVLNNFKSAVTKLKQSKYIQFVLWGVLLYSFSAIGDKLILNRGITPITYLFFINVFIGINFVVLTYLTNNGLSSIKITIKKVGWLIFLSALFSLGLRTAQFYAFTLTSIALVLSLKRVISLLSVIIGGEMFHEHNLQRKILASVIMIAGVLLITVQ